MPVQGVCLMSDADTVKIELLRHMHITEGEQHTDHLRPLSKRG